MADAVRSTYRELSAEEKATIADFKIKGQAFIDDCEALGKSRELSLAITKIEEAVMWAVKHVTK